MDYKNIIGMYKNTKDDGYNKESIIADLCYIAVKNPKSIYPHIITESLTLGFECPIRPGLVIIEQCYQHMLRTHVISDIKSDSIEITTCIITNSPHYYSFLYKYDDTNIDVNIICKFISKYFRYRSAPFVGVCQLSIDGMVILKTALTNQNNIGKIDFKQCQHEWLLKNQNHTLFKMVIYNCKKCGLTQHKEN